MELEICQLCELDRCALHEARLRMAADHARKKATDAVRRVVGSTASSQRCELGRGRLIMLAICSATQKVSGVQHTPTPQPKYLSYVFMYASTSLHHAII